MRAWFRKKGKTNEVTSRRRVVTVRRIVVGLLSLAGIAGLLLGVAVFWPMDPTPYLRIEPSGEVLDRHGQLLYAFLNREGQWCFERDLDAISPYLIQATIAVEDQRFYRHPGVDPLAVARALGQDLKSRRAVSGASTLTMQAVKRVHQGPRSPWRKAYQALDALRLERHVQKADVLHTYLNTAPYGLNLVGCEAAARRYFGKPSSELTLAEAALVAGMPKAPSAYAPVRNPKRALERRNHVLRRMFDEGYIAKEDLERALGEPLGATWHDFPADAPHVAMRLKPDVIAPKKVTTTLDKAIQARAQELARATVARCTGQIGNGSAIVIDTPTGDVLAHVGSADFFRTPGGGQVDACRARRSPGSALKPFTYADAIERNCLYASEILLDYTLDYGLYSPGNMDSTFCGLISASDALRTSRNVPAVTVLERTGYAEVSQLLRRAGLTTLVQAPEYYGLGLTLGDCEVRLDELAAAYAMIARLGEFRPLKMVADRNADVMSASTTRRRLSRGTCLALYEMLEQPLPQEFGRERVSATLPPPRVCWKTGTSTGHHDAWAFVFNAQYVVGVWMGNNDGAPSDYLVGVRVALPLAAAIFRSLPRTNAAEWPSAGADLRTVCVCASSGLPAAEWCPHTRNVLVPRNQYLNRRCDVHYPVTGDCPQLRVVERWPGKAKGWDLAKVSAAFPNPRQPNAKKSGDRIASMRRMEAMRILAPSGEAEYVLTGETGGDRILLRSSVDDEQPLYWYLNDTYLGESEPQRPLYLDLKPGKHQLACMSAPTAGSAPTAAAGTSVPAAMPVGMLDKVTFNVVRPGPAIQFRN